MPEPLPVREGLPAFRRRALASRFSARASLRSARLLYKPFGADAF